MQKIVRLEQDVYSKLLEKKAQVISEEGYNLTFSELIRRLL